VLNPQSYVAKAYSLFPSAKRYILQIRLLNEQGWLINSSFSNQKLYGCVAQIDPNITVERDRLGVVYPHTPEGIHQLYQNLTCLQCRAVLQEWVANSPKLWFNSKVV